MARLLFAIGAAPFLVLGMLHILYSLADTVRPRRIVPRDRELIERMRASPLVLTRETDMWKAWLGFNLSHGLGVALFGALYLFLAAASPGVLAGSPVLRWAAPAVAAVYLGLALRYWFRIPVAGTAIGTAAFLAAAVLAA